MTVTITAKQLEYLDACRSQVVVFREIFGERVQFRKRQTLVNAARQHASVFDFNWAADRFLNRNLRQRYLDGINRICRESQVFQTIKLSELEKARAELFANLLWDQSEAGV